MCVLYLLFYFVLGTIMESVSVYYRDLPTTVRAFVVYCDGYYTIILNSRNSYEQNIQSYWHEMSHIMRGDFSHCVDVDALEHISHRLECLV